MTFSLRAATPEDVVFVNMLEDTCMRAYAEALWQTWIPSILKYGFDADRHRIVQAEGKDVGCIDVWNKGDHLLLNKLYLLPLARGRGIGARLLALVREEAMSLGLPLRLTVLTTNPRAQKFYEREGLCVIDRTDERVLMEPAA